MIESKIKSIAQLKRIAQGLRRKGKTVVFTNGCFDLLHFGHVKYLQAAKKSGDVLIVALNTDSSIKRIKGKGRPVLKQVYRLGQVAGLESVDFVTLFDEETPLKAIKAIRPDVLVKGSDWKKDTIVGADFVRKYGGKVLAIKVVKGLSTTNLIKIIARRG